MGKIVLVGHARHKGAVHENKHLLLEPERFGSPQQGEGEVLAPVAEHLAITDPTSIALSDFIKELEELRGDVGVDVADSLSAAFGEQDGILHLLRQGIIPMSRQLSGAAECQTAIERFFHPGDALTLNRPIVQQETHQHLTAGIAGAIQVLHAGIARDTVVAQKGETAIFPLEIQDIPNGLLPIGVVHRPLVTEADELFHLLVHRTQVGMHPAFAIGAFDHQVALQFQCHGYHSFRLRLRLAASMTRILPATTIALDQALLGYSGDNPWKQKASGMQFSVLKNT